MIKIGGEWMLVRELSEKNEALFLSDYASKSSESKGRQRAESECEIRTAYQRDRDRIIHSKAFRRLKHKTQVFLSPEGDHYRTRLTHTLEVSQIARTIARALRLNEDLTEAIALGHDLGHTPFGHCGEYVLNDIHKGGFEHNVQSLRVVDYLERRRGNSRGINLTEEVRDGILNHRGVLDPCSLEGQVVKLCDRIAYINHDIDDALRAEVLEMQDIPKRLLDEFGYSHSTRINTMILDVIHSSEGQKRIHMSNSKREALVELRSFMFDSVYLNTFAKREEGKAQGVVRELYRHFMKHPSEMPIEFYDDYLKDQSPESIKDYIAGMSDRYAIKVYEKVFIPKYWV